MNMKMLCCMSENVRQILGSVKVPKGSQIHEKGIWRSVKLFAALIMLIFNVHICSTFSAHIQCQQRYMQRTVNMRKKVKFEYT